MATGSETAAFLQAQRAALRPPRERPDRRPDQHAPIPLLAMNGALDRLPHDPAVRAAADLLCRGSPIVRTGSACNLSCTYCCVGDDGLALEAEASLLGLVDGLADQGYRGIGYMGGEPTIHPKWLNVVRHAKARGFRCQMLCTNGLKLADADFAASLFDAGVNAVTTSLDAFDPGVQAPLYGNRSDPRKALAGLDHVLAAPGVEVLVSAVVTAHNAPLLAGYMDEVAARQQRCGKPIGVMLCVLQQPAKDGPEQRTLTLPLLESARLVNAALARARQAGVAALTFGYPPCMLEGHERNVSELYCSEWVVRLEAGSLDRSRLTGTTVHWRSCAECRHAAYCPGVLKRYADPTTQAFVASREPATRDSA